MNSAAYGSGALKVDPRASHAVHRFADSLIALAWRQLRSIARSRAALMPALAIPLLFYAVERGSLDRPLEHLGVSQPAAFLLPVSLLMAVSSSGAGLVLVEDINSGYLDKLLLTGVSPAAVLLGAMVGDLVRTALQALVLIAVGLLTGLSLDAGATVLLLVLALGWTIAFGAIGYVIALRTASARAVQSAVMLFFPFVFLTSAFVPQQALAGWMATIARFNPVTYVLDGLRSASGPPLHVAALADGAAAVGVVAAVTVPLAVVSFRTRVSQ